MTIEIKAAGPVVSLPAREIPLPAAISDAAREALSSSGRAEETMPALDDHDAWRKLIAQRTEGAAAMRGPLTERLKADVEATEMAGVPVYVGRPRGERLIDERRVVFDIHGGALIFGGGESAVRFEAAAISLRTGRVTYALDYRVPPDGPYPAALDDCLAVYRALLAEHKAEDIVVSGTSAGGNLAAALLLRARDEGLPMPAGAILLTPELDLTESGDSFHTLMGLDTVLRSRLTEMNLYYAAGADLTHPYLSPLLGDVSGFPPTFLQAGGRDIFLSNTILMHRKLRRAGVRAELHVWEGMPHGGFNGFTPEDREVSAEMQAFIASL
ncbi:MAG: alpha/beta hydrolase [Caulobacteraceae bacterium]